MSSYGRILSLENLVAIRDSLGTVVCTSGGFDPLHPGHATCIVDSKDYGDTLVVIVNGDEFLSLKKGRPFMDLATRCSIVACLRGVDYVVPFEAGSDMSVSDALRVIRPDVFTKGGDRTSPSQILEWDVCRSLGIRVITGVGESKRWSSSWFLREWGDFWLCHTRASTEALPRRGRGQTIPRR